MNDPGLDEPISNDANDVEKHMKDEHAEREEDEQAFLEPRFVPVQHNKYSIWLTVSSRWWFASTAFPLIAGTFGPMASAFSICALVVHWRTHVPPGQTEDQGVSINDPKWLIGINAAQLGVALISNLSLLMNMARRVRFSIAQPITIIGWYISAFALTGLCACAGGPLKLLPEAEQVYTQAYFYAIFAAGLYFLVATLMLVTVWGAYQGHYDKEFQLTMSQRTLMLQTISYFVYLLAGAAIFSHIEGWSYLDAVYWADFTLLTVGIGDYAPSTHLGRSLLFPFAIGGIIILGLVIGSIRSLVLERGKVKMGARMVEKERRRLLKKMEKKHKSSILEPIANNSTKALPSNGNMSRSSTLTSPQNSETKQMTERQRRQKEFTLMRQIQEHAHSKRRWTSLIISSGVWFFLWFIGALVFSYTEGSSSAPQNWSYFTSLYFAYTSLLTIGYGDISPTSPAGKAFFVFWSLLAVPSLTILISNMGDTIVKGIRDLTLWVGEFTVLPGDAGIKATLMKSASKVSGGKIFAYPDNNNEQDSDNDKEFPPGILGIAKRRKNKSKQSGRNDPESAAQNELADNADMETSQANQRSNAGDPLPKSKHHYHVLLIEEIGKVMRHIHSSPPRKYSFEEWAWYLKLVGEDEGDSDTHRKAIRKIEKGEKDERVRKEGKEGIEWSWVGVRSPLMGGKGEAEWVLERLTKTLQRELEAMGREEEERWGMERKNKRGDNGHGEGPDDGSKKSSRNGTEIKPQEGSDEHKGHNG